MKKLIILLIFLVTYSVVYADIRLAIGVDVSKGVNWIGGNEFYIKGTTNVQDSVDIKYGVSQFYDSTRESPFNYNHGGYRIDMGFLWHLPLDFKLGYTHSQRNTFEGNNADSLYSGHSVDTVSIRKELTIK